MKIVKFYEQNIKPHIQIVISLKIYSNTSGEKLKCIITLPREMVTFNETLQSKMNTMKYVIGN